MSVCYGSDYSDDETLLGVIEMFKSKAAIKYEQKLIDQNTQEVTEKISVDIARNLKDVLSDEVIAQKTGLDIEIVKNL